MECPACGLRELDFEFVEKHSVEYKAESLSYSIFRCLNCGTEFSDPMKPAPPEWYAHTNEFYGWRWEFDEFIADLEKDKERLKILEIGCGEGSALEKLHEKYDVCGLDFNVQAINVAMSKGVEVYSMTLDKFIEKFPDRRFDAIALFQVIEHIDNPIEFLDVIKSILNKDGKIYISIPNPKRISLFVEREWWDYPPHHLTRFSEAGIDALMKRAGFDGMMTKSQPVDSTSYDLTSLFANKVVENVFKIDVGRLARYQRVIVKSPIIVFTYPIFRMIYKFIQRGRTGRDFYLTGRCCSANDK